MRNVGRWPSGGRDVLGPGGLWEEESVAAGFVRPWPWLPQASVTPEPREVPGSEHPPSPADSRGTGSRLSPGRCERPPTAARTGWLEVFAARVSPLATGVASSASWRNRDAPPAKKGEAGSPGTGADGSGQWEGTPAPGEWGLAATGSLGAPNSRGLCGPRQGT